MRLDDGISIFFFFFFLFDKSRYSWWLNIDEWLIECYLIEIDIDAVFEGYWWLKVAMSKALHRCESKAIQIEFNWFTAYTTVGKSFRSIPIIFAKSNAAIEQQISTNDHLSNGNFKVFQGLAIRVVPSIGSRGYRLSLTMVKNYSREHNPIVLNQ